MNYHFYIGPTHAYSASIHIKFVSVGHICLCYSYFDETCKFRRSHQS